MSLSTEPILFRSEVVEVVVVIITVSDRDITQSKNKKSLQLLPKFKHQFLQLIHPFSYPNPSIHPKNPSKTQIHYAKFFTQTQIPQIQSLHYHNPNNYTSGEIRSEFRHCSTTEQHNQ